MNWKFQELLKILSLGEAKKHLTHTRHGLERETLRVTPKGELAMTPHPKPLGSPLTNPYISTDFAEPLLEFITPPLASEKAAVQFMHDIHHFTYRHLKGELLWPASMPCRLPRKDSDIPLAQYGGSYEGIKRTTYRHGLGLRYGRRMQTVSGIHYNFSFSKELWGYLHKKLGKKEELKEFITTGYFHIMRNFLRYGWLNIYLFGASPAVDRSFLSSRPASLNRCSRHTCYGQYATSLRMSDFGYNSKVQAQLMISYNSLDEYVQGLEHGVTTPHPLYKKLGVEKNGKKLQLNDHLLQIENEYYAPIRPKQPPREGETVRGALRERGVKYLELRSIDINPQSPTGVSEEELCFLHIFMVYCLCKESPPLSKEDKKLTNQNWNNVALYGRNPDLTLNDKGKKRPMRTWGLSIMKELENIAALLDEAQHTSRYTRILHAEQHKLDDPTLTPSYRIMQELIDDSLCFVPLQLDIARAHRETILKKKISTTQRTLLQHAAAESLKAQRAREIRDEYILEEYKDMELSTQLIIRAAQKRGITVEVMDRTENMIRLTKGKKTEYLKQATETSKDSLITYFLLGNKEVQKRILREQGFSVPEGRQYHTIESALKDYSYFKNRKVVIKPTNSNYGIGITFVPPHDEKTFITGIHEAFTHDRTVIVEDFISGMEFRFLVIKDKVIGIVKRNPANVTGDGTHTISELIDLKNTDPLSYKPVHYYIRKGREEQEMLRAQNLTLKSIPKKGKTVYMRLNSNVSTGGDAIDCTDEIPAAYKKIAVEAMRAIHAHICGLDIIIPNFKKIKPLNYAIIELNYNPALYMHGFPYRGTKRNTVDPILDLLGF